LFQYLVGNELFTGEDNVALVTSGAVRKDL